MKMNKLNPILIFVVLILLGLVLILWPDASVTGIVRLTAFGLLAAAIVGIIMHVVNKEEKKGTKAVKLIQFVLYAALGLWILVNPVLFEGFYQIVIGIIIAANALKDLVIAIKENKHWAFLALAIISLVLGVIVMCNPFTLFRTFAVISGISLVYSGIVSLLSEIKSGGKSKSDESAEKAK